MSTAFKAQKISHADSVGIDYDHLRYRSQFVLGPAFADMFPSPQCHTIRPGLNLTVHPDLNVTIASHQGKTLALLGFMLDPYDPEATDNDILETLVQEFNDCYELFTRTTRFGGRWVLIAEDGSNSILFNDPAGLRQVFYNMAENDAPLWCATQSHVIARLLGVDKDEEAVAFVNSPEISANREHWMPGDSTLYKEIRHLLPNHFLDLKTSTSKRFWPHADLPNISMDEAIPRCATLLTGQLMSAANRYDCALALTAGSDSRLLLAASKPIKDQIEYFTVYKHDGLVTEDHPDLTIPRALSQRFGLKYEVIEQPDTIDESFTKVFTENTSMPHEIWHPDTLALYNSYKLQKVTISGGISEMSKNIYYLPYFVERYLSSDTLSIMVKMGRKPYSIKAYQQWLGDLGRTFNVRPLDIFYLEQRAGNWSAMCQQEFDIAWREIISPFNCRLLFTTMMSVPKKYRQGQNCILYKNLTRYLWPEVMELPINPHKVIPWAVTAKKHLRNQLSSIKHLLLHVHF